MRSALLLLFVLLPIISVYSKHKKLKDLVVEFNRHSKQGTFGKEFKYYGILIESKLSDDYDDFVDEFNKAAQKYENKVKFMFMNTDIEENWQAIEYLGLIAEDIPAVLFIILDKGLTKFKMPPEEITKENIEKFIEDCFNGNAVSFAKSEDIPEDWDAKPVKQLVGKNFEENVFVEGKHSFVLFYAPWCTACQNTMPEFEKLGLLYNSDKNVIIAKVDSTANEVPKMPIFDVPTIALFVNGRRKPVYYTDTVRTAKAFSNFIKKHIEKEDDEKKPGVEDEKDVAKQTDTETDGDKRKQEKMSGKSEKPRKKDKAKDGKSAEKAKKADKSKQSKNIDAKQRSTGKGAVEDEKGEKMSKEEKKMTKDAVKKTKSSSPEGKKSTRKTKPSAESGKKSGSKDGAKKKSKNANKKQKTEL